MAPNIHWLPTGACFPPHRVVQPSQVAELASQFREGGWDMSQPALIGYPYGEGIQLLSGTHRHAAAMEAGIRVPVKIVPYSEVWNSFGHLERWLDLMKVGGLDGRE